MAEDDKPGEGGTAGRKRGKARRAPILDLEAKEIRDSESGSGKERAQADSPGEAGAKDTGTQGPAAKAAAAEDAGAKDTGAKDTGAKDDSTKERPGAPQDATPGGAPGPGPAASGPRSEKPASAAASGSAKSETGAKPGAAGSAPDTKSGAAKTAAPKAAAPASLKPGAGKAASAPDTTKAETNKSGAATSGTDKGSADAADGDKAGKPRTDTSVPGAGAEKSGAAAAKQERGGTARRSSSALAMFGAVLAGAFVSFVVLVGLDQAGVRFWRSSGDAQIDSKLADLEAQIGRVTERESQAGAPLEARVTQLEADIQRTAESVQGLPEVIEPLSTRVEENAQRLAALEEAVNELRGSAEQAVSGLAALESAVQEIGGRAGDGDGAPSLEALELKISSLDTRVQRLAEQGTAAGDAAQAAEGVRQTVAELGSSLAGLRDQVAALAERLDGQPESVTLDQLAALREDLGSRVGAIEERLGTPGEAAGAAAAIALSTLARTVENGAPYETQLAAYAALAPQDEVVEVLKPQAAEGIATLAQLAERFAEAAEAARREAQDSVAEGSFSDKVFARLQSVVSVRREGDEASGDPHAVIRRMEERVANGDLEGAVEAAGAADTALPEPVAAWVEEAKTRLEAERALEAANERMLAALGRLGG